MNDIKKTYQHRDRVVRAMSGNGMFRIAVAKTTETTEQARIKHDLDPLLSYLLGKTLTSSILLSSFLKGEERVIVQAEGTGRVKLIFAEAMQVGEVRGFVVIDESQSMPASLSDALSTGFLKVSKILYEKQEPVTGIVELVRGDIASDLSYYFEQSEQIITAVNLGVTINDDGEIVHSGGIIVQAMPGAELSAIVEVQRSLEEMPPIEELLDSGYSPEEILRQAMPFPIEVVNNTPVDFFCRCSLERFMSKLLTLGKEELLSMQAEGQRELVCQYCSSSYELTDEHFSKLINSL
ncbi:MAG: Hsp33 family molecular chaperone HslO [Ignavibacteria bacterium]|jgi:molecular chaperone Hsp33|nr:Hsp33 family molecular chaperone HslO [Ignavibacteria bacterium]